MKKFLIGLILIASFSCNTEESNTLDNDNSPQNTLSKIITTTYVFDVPDFINRKTYENNRPLADSIYSISNDVWLYHNFVYENNKLVLREISTSASNQIDQIMIIYDDLDRIIQTTEIFNSVTSTTLFTYDNQTITSVTNNNGDMTSKVFHLNTDGIIYKEVSATETIEIQYDEYYNVMVFESSIFGTSSYTYDNTVLPPANTQLFESYMFGDYKNNVVLYKNRIGNAGFSEIAVVPKYHISSTDENRTFTFEWTLNDNGYPIKRETLDENNNLMVKVDYLYN